MKVLLKKILLYLIIGHICKYFDNTFDIMYMTTFCLVIDLYVLIYDEHKVEFVEFRKKEDTEDE